MIELYKNRKNLEKLTFFATQLIINEFRKYKIDENKFYNDPLKLFDEHHNSINLEEISWIMQKLSDDLLFCELDHLEDYKNDWQN